MAKKSGKKSAVPPVEDIACNTDCEMSCQADDEFRISAFEDGEMKVFLDNGGVMPTKSYEQDAGFDLYMPRDIYIDKFSTATICLQVRLELPHSCCGIIHSRSSVAQDSHLIIIGCLVDSGYRGPIHLTLVNPNDYGVYVKKHQRVAQIVPTLIMRPRLVEIEDPEEFSDAQRGEKGQGSTGK